MQRARLDAPNATADPHVHSPERRTGKSRLLEVLACVVRRPVATANTSDAALFRLAAADVPPTLLFDEVDALFGPKARDREDTRALLNAGTQRGVPARRVGEGTRQHVEEFPVFCPKVLSGIDNGCLPDTLRDRTVCA